MVDNRDAPTRFCKVILPSFQGKTKLRIPHKFAGNYGGELSGVVKLTDPTGGIWRVGLEKIENSLWLCDGWKKFVDDHFISYGHFLVFKYKGNSTFNVNVFDLTSTEVDYPHDNPCNYERANHITQRTVTIKEENSEDESVQVLDFFNAKSNGRSCNLSFPSEELASGVKRRRSYAVERTNTKSKCKIEDDEVKTEAILCDEYNWQSNSNEIESSSGVESQSRNEAVDAGAKYLPENLSFTVILKKNKPLSVVYVPARVSKYLGAVGWIELVDCDGKRWPVHIIQKKGRKCIDRYLSRGWMTFVRQKNLGVGATCVFELIDNDKRTLKVSTFYNTSSE